QISEPPDRKPIASRRERPEHSPFGDLGMSHMVLDASLNVIEDERPTVVVVGTRHERASARYGPVSRTYDDAVTRRIEQRKHGTSAVGALHDVTEGDVRNETRTGR